MGSAILRCHSLVVAMKSSPFNGLSPLFFVLLLCPAVIVSASVYVQQFSISSNCQTANCYSLKDIFTESRLQISDTVFQLVSGSYSLDFIQSDYTLRGISNVLFNGTGSVVTCGPRVGLNFININGLSFRNITFLQCGAERVSTTPNPDLQGAFEIFLVALYLKNCSNITMSFVDVTAAPNGTGVAIYDCSGSNNFHNCRFINNTFDYSKHFISQNYNRYMGGGGGVYVEFTYCEVNTTCSEGDTVHSLNDVTVSFIDCSFINNKALTLMGLLKTKHIVASKMNHLSFGHGGGLAYFVRGNNSNIILNVERCIFIGNEAVRGGGLYAFLNNYAYGSNINVSGSEFTQNICAYGNSGKGGALALTNFVNDYNPSGGKNEFTVDNCTFTDNAAMKGGALSIFWVQQDATPEQVSSFLVSRSSFHHNVGKLGSAVYICQKIANIEGLTAEIALKSCNFSNNSATFYEIFKLNLPVEMGLGTVYLVSSSVKFYGNFLFESNSGTALGLADSSIRFDSSTRTNFTNNKGINGGALAMLGVSSMQVGKGISIVFINNTAASHGGAIYAKYIARQNLISDGNCFIRPIDPEPDPDKWEINMTFINNTENNGRCKNSIFTTSVLRCTSTLREDSNGMSIVQTLNWTGWDYSMAIDVQCGHYISSDIGRIVFTDTTPVSAYPGWEFPIPVHITDDFGHDILDLAIFNANTDGCIDEGVTEIVVWRDKLTLNAEEDCNFTLTLYSRGQRVWLVKVNVTMNHCPPGFSYDPARRYCQCNGTGRFVECDDKTHQATIAKNIWMGKLNESNASSEYEVVICPPYSYCARRDEVYTNLTYSLENEDMCAPHRKGILCGECELGYGPAVNSPEYACAICSHTGRNAFYYVLTAYVPLTVLFISLVIFDIRLTSGPANAFIVYSQVIVTTFTLDANGGIPIYQIFNITVNATSDDYGYFLQAYKYPYHIFNLNFIEQLLPPLCLSDQFNTLTVLMLESIVAVMPFVMILAIIIAIRLKDIFCLNCAANSTRMWSRRISNALLPSFASFLLLSYTKFSLISTELVQSVKFKHDVRRLYLAAQLESLYTYQSIFGIVILCTFVAITPILLLDYPVRVLEWIVGKSSILHKLYPQTKVHILLDTFQGCYKKNTRFFAGVYFLFRLVVNLSFVLSSTWIETFVIKQITVTAMILLLVCFMPYRQELNYINYVDIFIFSTLAFQNCFSFFLFVTYKIDPTQNDDKYVAYFCLQYITVFLPLFFMVLFILYKNSQIKKCVSKVYSFLKNGGGVRTRNYEVLSSDAENSILQRAKDTNQYCREKRPQSKQV